MELLIKWMIVMFRYLALIVTAVGAGIYCLWAVICYKCREWVEEDRQRKSVSC